MRDLAFWVATGLYVLAIALAYLNRDSERVLTTLFLGWVALIGAVLGVTLFSSERSVRKVFSTPIIIHGDTRLPLEGLPYPVLPMDFAIHVREKLKDNPALLPDPNADSFAQSTYHHALQRAIVYWLEQKYPSTWQVDIYPMTLGEMSGYSFQSRQVSSRLYPPPELEALMSGNQFSEIRSPFGTSDKFGLATPEGTKIISHISASRSGPGRGVKYQNA